MITSGFGPARVCCFTLEMFFGMFEKSQPKRDIDMKRFIMCSLDVQTPQMNYMIIEGESSELPVT